MPRFKAIAIDAVAFNKIQGKPFTLHEIYNKIKELVEE